VYFNGHLLPYDDSAFHIQPDFYIYSDGDEYSIEPEFDFIPAILTQYYLEKINSIDSLTAIEKKCLLKKLDKVKGIINQHYQRNKNIVNAIKSIVRLQKDFFDFGSITNLGPLIARDVANEINLDESTVRRIRKNKYLDTPHGIFELDFFFDQVGYDTLNGMKMASKGVKELISNIIKSENKETPYKDQKITDILKTKYLIDIKVRTIGKYRESMGILPARLRKWPC
jgi:RNA polymerase sigma-54 factor